MSSKNGLRRRTIRCAIYTRKSTEEGLEQEFNSLDAQREAAEAYIASQRQEGWVCLPARYDDGGYSGGNLERPALQRLLADIEAGQVDCVVSYKVDRLSRSLLGFARMMETFDKHQVSFVSITQQFNSSTSMGRLILNVLLSFAQFERELIAERTRDKMGAARRKGKRVGGRPLLGYDLDPHRPRLVVNPTEARQVRAIFRLYVRKGGLLPTVQELNRRGWRLKRWTTRKGSECGGRPFTKTNLHQLLRNVAYIGQVCYQGTIYPGEQRGIVPLVLFQQVQTHLRRHGRAPTVRRRQPALLRGLLCCKPCGCAMGPSYTRRHERTHRYYVCQQAQRQGWVSCPSKSVPAEPIEGFVLEQVRREIADFEPRWPLLSVDEQARALAERVERIEYDGSAETVWITYCPTGNGGTTRNVSGQRNDGASAATALIRGRAP